MTESPGDCDSIDVAGLRNFSTEHCGMSCTLREEVCGADLGDARLNRRLETVIESLGASPSLSVPAATRDRAEMEAAYRFFGNPRVTAERMLEPHFRVTRERIAECDTVLLVQDTTELDLTRPQQQVAGAGPLDCESRRGVYVHPLMAFDASGLPLGTVWQKTWTRDSISTGLTKAEKAKLRKQMPIEEKESLRWLEGLRAARDVAASCPHTTCICVGDSEADIYELFVEPRSAAHSPPASDQTAPRVELLIRAGQTRSTEHENWLDDIRQTDCLDQGSVTVSRHQPKVPATKHRREQAREPRTAQVEIRAGRVTVRPPDRLRRNMSPVQLNVVLVEEPHPPAGAEPVRWLLATTLPIDTLEAVRLIVAYYCLRWRIEIFFRTLKSGCRIERRLFEMLPRTLNCLALYMIVAWRVMYLVYLGRECPDLDCEVVFTPSEWKSVYCVVSGQQPPQTPPRLNEIIRMIATLGGFIDRAKSEPGTQTMWIGLMKAHCLTMAWDSFGPGS